MEREGALVPEFIFHPLLTLTPILSSATVLIWASPVKFHRDYTRSFTGSGHTESLAVGKENTGGFNHSVFIFLTLVFQNL